MAMAICGGVGSRSRGGMGVECGVVCCHVGPGQYVCGHGGLTGGRGLVVFWCGVEEGGLRVGVEQPLEAGIVEDRPTEQLGHGQA